MEHEYCGSLKEKQKNKTVLILRLRFLHIFWIKKDLKNLWIEKEKGCKLELLHKGVIIWEKSKKTFGVSKSKLRFLRK